MSFLGINRTNAKRLEEVLRGVPQRRHFVPQSAWHIRVPVTWGHRGEVDNYVDDLRLLFVRDGTGCYWIEGQEFPLRRGSVIFLYTGTTFCMKADPDDPPLILASRFQQFENGTNTVAATGVPAFHIACQTGDAARLEPYFLHLAEAYSRSARTPDENVLSSLLHAIMLRLRDEVLALEQTTDARILEAQQYLDANVAEAIDWGKLAAEVGLSRDYLGRRFKRETGQSLKSYHVQARMRYAQFLLESSSQSVGDIAAALGYSDQFVFSRQFKRTVGVSPQTLRRR